MALFQINFRYAGLLEMGIYRSRAASQTFVDGDSHSGSLWTSLVDTVDALGNEAPGIVLKVQTWTVLTEQHTGEREGDLNATATTTLVQTYTTITPVLIREPCSFRWEKHLLEKYLIPAWDRGISAAQQSLENALLDQMHLS